MTVATGIDSLKELVERAISLKASDIHLHTGYPPTMRLAGSVVPMGEERLADAPLRQQLMSLLSEHERKTFEEKHDADFTVEIPQMARLRGSVFLGHLGINASFRVLPPVPLTLAELGVPTVVEKFAEYHHGLVLLTGPAGCGKSTTLSALVNMLNEKHEGLHILTLEDPIEVVHPHKKCMVNQRQVILHTTSYERAMRAALRESPDVIIIGEMRDAETISLALTAAETGHLVMASMHTTDSIKSITRIVDSFHPDKQPQIRTMLAESLQAVFSQLLLPCADGKGRALAYELLFINPAVANMIREKKTFQIPSVLQTGRAQGMMSLSQSIGDLVRAGKVTKEVAKRYADEAYL
ncbi:MAG: PilT/PilU family type 4a pilus ATPase [Candidatus Obscuribacterales bacterium]|nr:PilT/PilU family type 4a pilus ATPase [Candidatus Obscuribacterales bacterium]